MLPIAIIIVLCLLVVSSGVGYAYYTKNKAIVCPKYAKCTDKTFTCPNGFTKTSTGCECPNGYITMSGGSPMCNTCPNNAKCSDTDFTCASGFTKGDSSCICPVTNYVKGSGSGATCGTCPSNALCHGTNTFDCPDNFIKSELGCDCQDGYITRLGTKSACNKCPINSVCDTTGFHCNNGFTSNGSACVCPPSKYTTATGSCIDCPQNAFCNGGTGYTCPPGFTDLGNGLGCVCGAGKTIMGSGQTLKCVSCVTNASTTCNIDGTFTCKAPYTLTNGECLCYSGTGYVDNNGMCAKCPNYAVCNGTGYDCSAFGFTDVNGSCVCPDGYISFDGTNYYCRKPCPTYAKCASTYGQYGPRGYVCDNNYSIMNDGSCLCYGGTGYINSSGACVPCPQYAKCDGTANYDCSYYGFTKQNGMCVCDKDYISFDGKNYHCNGPCPDYATCYNTYDNNNPTGYTCDTGFTNASNNCLCDGGYITPFLDESMPSAGGISNIVGSACDTCPLHANCDGNTLKCINGFVRGGGDVPNPLTGLTTTSYTCNCPGYITGTGTNQKCNACPKYGICNENSTSFSCVGNSLVPAVNNVTGVGYCACPSGQFIFNDPVHGPGCMDCPKYGICNGTDSYQCPFGFSTTDMQCKCPNTSYIAGATGPCVPCPPYASCGGTIGFNCPSPLMATGSSCACPDGSYITGVPSDVNSVACSINSRTVELPVSVLGGLNQPTLAGNVINPYRTTVCNSSDWCPNNLLDGSSQWIWVNSSTTDSTNVIYRFAKKFTSSRAMSVSIVFVVYNIGTIWLNDTKLGVVSSQTLPQATVFNGNIVAGDNYIYVDAIHTSAPNNRTFAGVCGTVRAVTTPATATTAAVVSTIVVTDVSWTSIPLSRTYSTCPSNSSRSFTGVDTGIMGCKCDANLYWDPITYSCKACGVNAAAATVATGDPISYDTNYPENVSSQCRCIDYTYFNNGAGGCGKCTTDSTVVGTGMSIGNRCKCKDPTYRVSFPTLDCVKCPINTRTDSIGMQVPDDGKGLGFCKCDNPAGYWYTPPTEYVDGWMFAGDAGCRICPTNSNRLGLGPAIPNIGNTGMNVCKCNSKNQYWKEPMDMCDTCPGRSVYVKPEDVYSGVIPGGSWVPVGANNYHITLGQTPPLTCACPNGEQWPCL